MYNDDMGMTGEGDGDLLGLTLLAITKFQKAHTLHRISFFF